MRTSRPTLTENRVEPLQFTLASHLSTARSVIEHLYERARSCEDFESVSPVACLSGDGCMVGCPDPIDVFKIHARKTIVLDANRVFSIAPNKFVGFCCLMPNRNFLRIGLAKYPKSFKVGRLLVPVSGPGQASWQGIVETISPINPDIDASFRSHLAAIELLDSARYIGALRDVRDPTVYWELRDPEHLSRALRRLFEQMTERVH